MNASMIEVKLHMIWLMKIFNIIIIIYQYTLHCNAVYIISRLYIS